MTPNAFSVTPPAGLAAAKRRVIVAGYQGKTPDGRIVSLTSVEMAHEPSTGRG